MKADWNDAPDYISRRPRKGAVAWLIPGLIGTAIMLAALQMVSSTFLKGTAQGIVNKRTQPKPTPVAEISRAEPAATKDWDRVVKEVAARGAMPQPQTAQPKAATAEPQPKKTVFDDKKLRSSRRIQYCSGDTGFFSAARKKTYEPKRNCSCR